MNTIRCTVRGRLDHGKGADLLIELLPHFLQQTHQHQREFHIIGTGTYYNTLLQLADSYPQIKMYGRLSRTQITTIASAGQYCLCPSTFLETFGMSALEGCKLGLPVIGPNKGGLQQFVLQDLQGLWTSSENDHLGLGRQLSYIDMHHSQLYPQWHQQTLTKASAFGPAPRLSSMSQLIKSS